MVNIARNHACSCTYYASGAPSIPLGGSRLWARENHGTRPVEGQQPSEAVFEIVNDWYSEGTNYQFMGMASNGRCTGNNICEHYVHVSMTVHSCMYSLL